MVACAHFGGYVLGGDIDCNLLHGRGMNVIMVHWCIIIDI